MNNPVASYHYFDIIEDEDVNPGRKTRDYVIVNRRSSGTIGAIRWYGPGRQHCFFPEPNTVWSDGCIADIQEFLLRLREDRVNSPRVCPPTLLMVEFVDNREQHVISRNALRKTGKGTRNA